MTDPHLERFQARFHRLTRHAPDVRIPVPGSGWSAYRAVCARFLPSRLQHAVAGFRCRGKVDETGRGAVESEQPFGGSVIEGYHRVMTLVLEDAVVITGEDGETPDAPSEVSIWCADPELRAALEACVRGAA